MCNITSISLFVLLSGQLPRTLNLIFEDILLIFEYFSFWQWTVLKVYKFEIDCWFLLLFLCVFYFILFELFLFIFGVKNYDCFMLIFFSFSFFLEKYLILLMYCFIMYWPTDNSDILSLYTCLLLKSTSSKCFRWHVYCSNPHRQSVSVDMSTVEIHIVKVLPLTCQWLKSTNIKEPLMTCLLLKSTSSKCFRWHVNGWNPQISKCFWRHVYWWNPHDKVYPLTCLL